MALLQFGEKTLQLITVVRWNRGQPAFRTTPRNKECRGTMNHDRITCSYRTKFKGRDSIVLSGIRIVCVVALISQLAIFAEINIACCRGYGCSYAFGLVQHADVDFTQVTASQKPILICDGKTFS